MQCRIIVCCRFGAHIITPSLRKLPIHFIFSRNIYYKRRVFIPVRDIIPRVLSTEKKKTYETPIAITVTERKQFY